MLKHYVAFEEKKDDCEVKIYISSNCPLGFVHDALFKARTYVIEKINEANVDSSKNEDQEQIKQE